MQHCGCNFGHFYLLSQCQVNCFLKHIGVQVNLSVIWLSRGRGLGLLLLQRSGVEEVIGVSLLQGRAVEASAEHIQSQVLFFNVRKQGREQRGEDRRCYRSWDWSTTLWGCSVVNLSIDQFELNLPYSLTISP